jgi:hypothetical protein
MNRDTEELPAIMSEMERDMEAIEEFWFASFTPSRHSLTLFSTQLTTMKDNSGRDLQHLADVVNKLEELGEILEEMLRIQDSVEVKN